MVNSLPIDIFLWQPIETAPADEKLWLEVTGGSGDKYALPFACTRTGDDYFTERGTKLQVTPVRWKAYFPRKLGLNPRYKDQRGGRLDGVGRTQYANISDEG